MRVLYDEDYLCDEPCASCEHMYIEDIWNECQCDEKECCHYPAYIRSQLVTRRRQYEAAATKTDDHDEKLIYKAKASGLAEALDIMDYKGEYEDE